MLLKCVHILIEIEEPGGENLDLVVGQMAKGGLEQRGDVLLDVEHVVVRWTELHRDSPCLNQCEHVGENGGVILQASRVGRIRHDGEYLH